MVWIHATRIVASMNNDHAGLDLADMQLIGDSVGFSYAVGSTAKADNAIAMFILAAEPQPTTRHGLWNIFLLETLSKRGHWSPI